MNARIAKKIVQRFKSDPVTTLGYNEDQILRAHRIVKEPVPQAGLVAWREAQKARRVPPKVSARVGIMEVTIHAGDDGKLGTADDIVEVGVLKQKAVPEKPDYRAMNVTQLKAAAKAAGQSGYSSLKKADLIALLEGL